ncbi:hypothetical protein [Lactococcus allomyrinae]|uniref:Uncharacterized protein n=1 Tax=Lactococcus allomyrinae TaxID=2419773 RepID=A0A387B932_9LACT|nr:hypothetical protein [Lactococcus allomyrinae]AYG00335.1 hypothetical protein D7I46_04055 [Lactococcus allomyrinae]
MKKRNKIILGVTIPVILIAGGIIMTQTPFDLFLTKNFTAQSKESTRQMQVDYLKKHEKEMTEFVMSQNKTQSSEHQIKSIQWDWESIQVQEGGGPISSSTWLTISGGFNHIKDSNFSLDFTLDNTNDIPSIKAVDLSQSFTVDGGQKGYE